MKTKLITAEFLRTLITVLGVVAVIAWNLNYIG